MRKLSRGLVAATMALGLASLATPAQADHHWGYDCVRYPCYPEDYVEYVANLIVEDLVSIDYNPPVVCVTEPCDQPPPYTVCINPLELCTA